MQRCVQWFVVRSCFSAYSWRHVRSPTFTLTLPWSSRERRMTQLNRCSSLSLRPLAADTTAHTPSRGSNWLWIALTKTRAYSLATHCTTLSPTRRFAVNHIITSKLCCMSKVNVISQAVQPFRWIKWILSADSARTYKGCHDWCWLFCSYRTCSRHKSLLQHHPRMYL